jgi:hypothetical protein
MQSSPDGPCGDWADPVAIARRGRALAADGCALAERCVDDATCTAFAACLEQGLGELEGPAARDVLQRCPGLRDLLASSPLPALAGDTIGGSPFPIAAILFDKHPDGNWVVAAHQDLAMPVRERIEAEGFTGWSSKGGVPYVLPPDRVLAGLVALRLHLDDCPIDNGALAVLPGSHARGRWTPAELAALRADRFTAVPARRGDVLLLRPLLVHRSAPATIVSRRRVLHVVYAREQPLPARWRA